MSNKKAPVIMFVYGRPEHTEKTLLALKENHQAKETKLYIYADGAKDNTDELKVREVQELIANVKGFESVEIIIRNENYGLARNIIEGVSEVIQKHGKAIIVEDDIVTSKYFLTYMNEALNKYEDKGNVWHISGWNYPIDTKGLQGSFLWQTMNCWGWATWSDRWSSFNKNPEYLVSNWDSNKIKKFNLDGNSNFWAQVKANYDGKINTWAVFWYATIFDNNGLCLNPAVSYVSNIGHDGSGENSLNENTYDVEVNEKYEPLIVQSKENDLAKTKIINFYKKSKQSLIRRIYNKIRRLF
ncbi:glycosyltransferase [Vibrio sp. CAU 1672]|uniref:glycosyltransferase n=1 Tax=Vibrio sp. CAU 1672 TaxID=3032594 RepID=UPI0023DC88EF|nr:glycosyltransferase [Vibrio sp. CAU 1672]MDF2155719.1 glycosyltransferase [Vibrio sp. CAU 1672]